jgi:hypothetical protein
VAVPGRVTVPARGGFLRGAIVYMGHQPGHAVTVMRIDRIFIG